MSDTGLAGLTLGGGLGWISRTFGIVTSFRYRLHRLDQTADVDGLRRTINLP